MENLFKNDSKFIQIVAIVLHVLDFLIFATREVLKHEFDVQTFSGLRKVHKIIEWIPREYVHYIFWNIVKFVGLFGFIKLFRSKKIPPLTILRAMSFLNLASTLLQAVQSIFPTFPKLLSQIALKSVVYATVSYERVASDIERKEKNRVGNWYKNLFRAFVFASVESVIPWFIFGSVSSHLRNIF